MLFSLFSSNSEYLSTNDYILIYNPSRFLCLFSGYYCSSSGQPLVFEQIAIGIGILIQSSVITVLTIFCILTWLASLIADELKNGTENTFRNKIDCNDHPSPSQAVEKWFRDFHIFNRFVEAINSCFGTVLLLTFSNICVTSTYYWFRIVRRLCGESNVNFQALFFEFVWPLLLLYFRFFVLLLVSRQLQVKV